MKTMVRSQFKRLDNEKGSVLIISYFVILILLGVGAAFMMLSSNESRIAERQRLSTVAFHIAEAGIERALYDLKEDFISDSSAPGWADGDINGYVIGPDTVSFYTIPYVSTDLNNGSYEVSLKNANSGKDIWVKSVGTISDVSHEIQVYVKLTDISPWNNAIFAGTGAAGAMINGNVNVAGSIHILGTGLADGDLAMDLGGTAEIVRNNYSQVESALKALVPALPTTTVAGETVETLESKLRVKNGIVGLSGSSTVGEANVTGNTYKEKVDGSYVTDGFAGNQGAASVHSDNGTSQAYDLGDAVGFPSLSDPAIEDPSRTHQEYFHDNALVLTNELASITPKSTFSYSNANGSISMNGNGVMTISGRVYIDNNGVAINTSGGDKTVTYSGSGSLLVEGDVNINVNVVTSGAASFPTNIMGVMTPGNITFNEANINVMGIFYAETQVIAQKQTDIMGTIVSNYFDMGTNVPAINQVPETVNHMPIGMIGANSHWYLVVAWIKT